jgi:hypothetical protein
MNHKLLLGIFIGSMVLTDCTSKAAVPASEPSPDARFVIGSMVFHDDFQEPSEQWMVELERGGLVHAGNGRLDIDVPAGATVWFKTRLDGPVLIQYQAVAVSAGGVNDRVSDLNCFWMARDSRNPGDLFAVHRSGRFADYNKLFTYYVGLGGNGNTTTRFRRYIGDATSRPLLAQNDLHDPRDLLTPNRSTLLQLVADGNLIQYYRDGKRLFEMNDPDAYTSGWFAFRTTKSHLQISSFAAYRLNPPLQH